MTDEAQDLGPDVDVGPDVDLAAQLHSFFVAADRHDPSNSALALSIWPGFFEQHLPGHSGRINPLERVLMVRSAIDRLLELRSIVDPEDDFGGVVDEHLEMAQQIMSIDGLGLVWADMRSRISPQFLLGLRAASGLMRKFKAPAMFTSAQQAALVDLRVELVELLTLVDRGALPRGVQDVLRFHLTAMLEALDMAVWCGLDALRDATFAILGDPQLAEDVEFLEPDGEANDRAFDLATVRTVLKRVMVVAAVAANIVQLGTWTGILPLQAPWVPPALPAGPPADQPYTGPPQLPPGAPLVVSTAAPPVDDGG